VNLETIKSRVEALLGLPNAADRASELLTGTLTVLSAVYGPESHQVSTLRQASKDLGLGRTLSGDNSIAEIALGALKNLKGELDSGLVGSLQMRLMGEVLVDFVQLARAALDEGTTDGKNVASVLAAAAFEDTIRRMGASLAGIIRQDDLSAVIDSLKKQGILVAPQLGIAISYLNFRNRALHAQWDEIEREAVASALAFVEQLLLKHFQ
jgi:hypothetical protein